jgi:hypothetical protein
LIPIDRPGEPEEIARAVVFLAANDAGAIIGSKLSINGGQYMVWCDALLGVAYRTHIATKAGPNRTTRPDLTELSNFATSLTRLLLLGGRHFCDQTLERLKRLLGEISVEFGNLF